jgi:hypothetical protein
MKFLQRSGLLLGLLAAASMVFVVGCGGTVIDSTGMEETIQEYIEKSLHEDVNSVDCPSDQPPDPGLVIKCDVSLEGGKTKVAAVEVTNKDADFRIKQYGGSNE